MCKKRDKYEGADNVMRQDGTVLVCDWHKHRVVDPVPFEGTPYQFGKNRVMLYEYCEIGDCQAHAEFKGVSIYFRPEYYKPSVCDNCGFVFRPNDVADVVTITESSEFGTKTTTHCSIVCGREYLEAKENKIDATS